MSRALCPCDVMTSHIAVLLCGDLFHLVSRIAPKSHSIYPADAQYAPRLAAIVVLEPAERCDALADDGRAAVRRLGLPLPRPTPSLVRQHAAGRVGNPASVRRALILA